MIQSIVKVVQGYRFTPPKGDKIVFDAALPWQKHPEASCASD